MHELIRIDLEYRWRSDAAKAAGYAPRGPRSLEDYVAALPEIGPLCSLHLDLIGEEYRARRLWGDRPGAGGYLERFPGRERAITAELSKIDLELGREVESPPASAPFKSADLPGLIHIPQFDYRDFVLEAFLGSGGIGKVYRAWWKTRKRHVAIKMLRKSWWRHPDARTFFFREAAILVELRHPNVVSLHGVGHFRQNGRFLVIDLVDGGDLSRRIGEGLTVDQAMDWVMQAAEGLAFAHARGIVHRDIKPNNILLDRRGQVRVADFGLASAPSLSPNAADHLVGTAAYMAPEQLFNSSQSVDPAVDVFSLGCVLYTLLAAPLRVLRIVADREYQSRTTRFRIVNRYLQRS